MAEDLKDNWKKVGKDFTTFGAGLGKSLLNTMKTGVREATKWANDEKPEKAEDEAKTEEPIAEETQAEEPKAEETKAEEPKAEA